MRKLGLLVILAGLIATLPGPAGASASCRVPRGDPVIAENRSGALFVDLGDLWFCSYLTGEMGGLAYEGEGDYWFRPPAVHLSGRIAGYAFENGGGTRVVTVDLGRLNPGPGGRTRSIPAPTGPRVPLVRVGSLRVNGKGGLAWIQCPARFNDSSEHRGRCARPGRSVNSVYSVDSGSSKPVLLDRSRSVDPSSLRRAGARIYWQHGTSRRSAGLR